MWNIIFSLFFNPPNSQSINNKITVKREIENDDEGTSVDVNIWNIFIQQFERKLFKEVSIFYRPFFENFTNLTKFSKKVEASVIFFKLLFKNVTKFV